MSNIKYKILIDELNHDPIEFNKKGKSYLLLQEYFDGAPIESLRFLLKNKDPEIISAAMYVVSELPSSCDILIEEIISLTKYDNFEIQYMAYETLSIISRGKNTIAFKYIIESLESNSIEIRVLAMRLISNTDIEKLREISRLSYKNSTHKLGLNLILNDDREINSYSYLEMILNGENLLLKRYAVIFLKIHFKAFPDLIYIASMSSDIEIAEFASEVIEDLDDPDSSDM